MVVMRPPHHTTVSENLTPYLRVLALIDADRHPFTPLPFTPRPAGPWIHRDAISYMRAANDLIGDIRQYAGMSRAVPNEEAAITLMLATGGQTKLGGVEV